MYAETGQLSSPPHDVPPAVDTDQGEKIKVIMAQEQQKAVLPSVSTSRLSQGLVSLHACRKAFGRLPTEEGRPFGLE